VANPALRHISIWFLLVGVREGHGLYTSISEYGKNSTIALMCWVTKSANIEARWWMHIKLGQLSIRLTHVMIVQVRNTKHKHIWNPTIQFLRPNCLYKVCPKRNRT
jgi:hypothetical protein